MYTEQHEIFFASLASKLHECLSKLVANDPSLKHDDPTMWTLELIKRLKETENKVARGIDYWIDSILGYFITKFVIDTSISYGEDEWRIVKGP